VRFAPSSFGSTGKVLPVECGEVACGLKPASTYPNPKTMITPAVTITVVVLAMPTR
jgi:hypothetical protein